MLAAALWAEADALVASHAEETLPDGRQRVVRHGYGPERSIQTGIGALEVRRPMVRDRAKGVPAERKIRFMCGCPLFGKRDLRFSAVSSIGRVSGLWAWPSMTPRAGMLFGRPGSHRFRELQALEPRV